MANEKNRKRDRVIGEGMNSPDSTQMPLKASTGEPDWEALGDRGEGNRDQGNRDAEASDAKGKGAPRGARQNTGGDTDV